MSHFEKVKELIAVLKNCPFSEIKIHFSLLSAVFPNLSKPEKKEVAEDFYKWAEENKTSQSLKFAYSNYLSALTVFFAEDYESALTLSAASQKLFEAQNDADGIALCQVILGGSFRTLGNMDLALKELWPAYEQLKKSGIYGHAMMAGGFQIGSIYLELKNYEEALPLFKSVYETALQQKNEIWVVNASQGLGKVYLAQKKYAEAKSSLDIAIAASEKVKNPMFISISLTDLANYFSAKENYLEAEKLHKQALAIREEHKLIGGAITNCISISEIYIKQTKLDDAILFLEKGLKLAEQIKVKPKMFQIHLLLSEIFKQKNDLEKSLFHFKLYHHLREEVELEQSANKIKNVKLIFEAEQTKKENVIIKKQKAEIEKKNIELQETIDELTRTKVGKKAKAFTLIIAVVLFILEEIILHFVTHTIGEDNFYLSFGVKMAIILSLKPIESATEHFLLKKIIKKRKMEVVV